MNDNLKNQLIQYLRKEGKTDTWVNLYNKFPFRGKNITNKQKSDTVRKLFKRKVYNKSLSYNKGFPKILIFDLETAPLKSYVWRLWKQNINPLNGQLQSEWFMLTWSAKWLFDDKVYSDRLTRQEVLNENDSRITKSIYDLINQADIIIAHNCINFDKKVLNTRFLLNGLEPTTPYRVIDTLREAKKHFNFESNKLDYLAKLLGLDGKIKTTFSLWENCLKGDTVALREMEIYNIQDVKLLEEVYLALRPYIKSHPNLNVYNESDVERCPTCMSDKLNWTGKYATNANIYHAFKCQSCGSIGRARTPIKVDKTHLTISVAR